MPDDMRCTKCGATVRQGDRQCPQCGAQLTGATAPKPTMTIEGLKAWCLAKGMPLERMRFFIGEDYPSPRAFGIYRSGDRFIVYKNKADGSRAVRYDGPDEAYAVNELYEKLLDECHLRNIWPDVEPEQIAKAKRRHWIKKHIKALVIAVLLLFGWMGFSIYEVQLHAHDGYYLMDNVYYYRLGSTWYYNDYDRDWIKVTWQMGGDCDDYFLGKQYDHSWEASSFEKSASNSGAHRRDGYYLVDDRYYYRYGPSWYYDDYGQDWLLVTWMMDGDYDDDYLGGRYDQGWQTSDFEKSSAWESLHSEKDSSHSDYSSWDSNDTDWDSDW